LSNSIFVYLTYSSWIESFDPPLSLSPEDDPDGDDASQLLEYACGSDPQNRDGDPLRFESAGDGSLRLVFPIRPGNVDVAYFIDRLDPGGTSQPVLEHHPGDSNPLLTIGPAEAVFTLPPGEDGQALYRLRVRLLSPLP
jgi:hypothetical protein